jgi:cellulose synthase/poly-beta-1,6-N-acetylglucosamine synthase-like glycosyltransferase
MTMFLVFVGLSVLFAAAYCRMMYQYRRHWRQAPELSVPPDFVPRWSVTVLIAARNESACIGSCLASILNNAYPAQLLEVLVVDDHSTDDTAAQVRRWPQVRLLQAADFPALFPEVKSPKKRALLLGLQAARGNWVLCTDADVQAPGQWLRTLAWAAAQAPQAQVLCAPVQFFQEKSAFERWQSLDFAGMMLITGAGIFSRQHRMANGANLAFRRTLPQQLGAWREQQASGDDMFLVQMAEAQQPGSVVFVKNLATAVCTRAMPDWRSFYRQRLRWGSKNAALPEWPLKRNLALALACCTAIPVLALCAAFCFFSGKNREASIATLALLAVLGLKALGDWLLLRPATAFFQRPALMRDFWPAFFWHIVYLVAVGWGSVFTPKITWKGRILK